METLKKKKGGTDSQEKTKNNDDWCVCQIEYRIN